MTAGSSITAINRRRILIKPLRSAGTGSEADAPPQMVLVQHWFEELEARVPVN